MEVVDLFSSVFVALIHGIPLNKQASKHLLHCVNRFQLLGLQFLSHTLEMTTFFCHVIIWVLPVRQVVFIDASHDAHLVDLFGVDLILSLALEKCLSHLAVLDYVEEQQADLNDQELKALDV